jgi:hypothetical protein
MVGPYITALGGVAGEKVNNRDNLHPGQMIYWIMVK